MILSGAAIRDAVRCGDIVISPFNESQIEPNSYDFRLGERCIVYESNVLDCRMHNKTVAYPCDPKSGGWRLYPDKVYLFNTMEVIGSTRFVPIIRGRSSTGRLGIFTNITADLIDIGSINQLTLQIHVVEEIVIYPRMIIGQVTFWTVSGTPDMYSGKYKDRQSPVGSLSFHDEW